MTAVDFRTIGSALRILQFALLRPLLFWRDLLCLKKNNRPKKKGKKPITGEHI